MTRAYGVSIAAFGFFSFSVLWCGRASAESSVETTKANDGGFGHRRWMIALDAGIVGASQAYVDEQPGGTLVHVRGNGRYAYTEFSRFSPGIGARVSLGAVCKQVISGWSVRLALGYERIHHDTQFPYGDGSSDSNSAFTEHYSLDVRVILDRFRIKPYLSIIPAFAHLGLRGQAWVQELYGPYNSGMQDAWMSGSSLGANAGALIELVRTLSVDANVGYRRDWYDQTSEGSLDPYVESAEGLVVSIGLEWRPI